LTIGIYSFSSNVRTLRPIQRYDRAAIRQALDLLPRPGRRTAIGEALRRGQAGSLSRPASFENISWSSPTATTRAAGTPESVAREIFSKSQGAVQVYFVAFDTTRRSSRS